jgi:outer membrane protein OmpA-like peptidoglycan-associated protein
MKPSVLRTRGSGSVRPASLISPARDGAAPHERRPAVRMRTKTLRNLKERLVNDCNEASCRAQNRRVVTVLEQETGI